MPMLQVYRCPVCGAETQPGSRQPESWITVGGDATGTETFDRWECARRYVTAKEQEAESPLSFEDDLRGNVTEAAT